MTYVYPPPPGSPQAKKRSPILLILLLVFGFFSIGCVATVLYLPALLLNGLDVAEHQPPASQPPQSFSPPPVTTPPVTTPPVTTLPVTPPPFDPTSTPSPSTPQSSEPATAATAFHPYEVVPYTIEPLEIAEDAEFAHADEEFIAHYGEGRVARFTLKITDGPAPPQAADWLRRVLPKYVPAGITASVFVAETPNGVTGLVAPVRSLKKLNDRNFWGDKTKLDFPNRTVVAELAAAAVPPAVDSEEEKAALEKHTAALAGERYSQERQKAVKELVRMYSPNATAVLVAEACKPLAGSGFSGIIDFVHELEQLRPLPAGLVMDWYRENSKRPWASVAFNLIRASGDEFSAVEMETILSQIEDPTGNKGAQLKLELEDAIASIRSREAAEKKEEEAARAEDEAPPPAPQSPDVKHALKARDFALEFMWDQAAAAKKYNRQWVELTGRLERVGYDFKERPKLQLKTDNDWMSCVTKDPIPWKETTPGQTIVLKGRVDTDIGLVLADCEILNATGPQAIRPTPAQLGARYNDVFKGMEAFRKDNGRWVRTKGVICEIETGGRYFLLETGVDCKVRVSFFSLPEEKAKFPVGQTLSVLGRLHHFSPPPYHRIELDDCVLCEPPTGP